MKSSGSFCVPIPVGKTKIEKPADADIIAGVFQLPATACSRFLLLDEDSIVQIEEETKSP